MLAEFRPAWMTPDLDLVVRSVQRFAEREVAPHASAWDAARMVPRGLWTGLGAAGFLNCDIPEAEGGLGADYPAFAAVVEAFARLGHMAIASTMIGVHSGIVAHYLLNHGTAAQRARYLPGMTAGGIVAAIAMTEPAAGSDLQGIRTRAVRDGGGWVLNGQKTFISNGQHCDLVVVAARTDTSKPGAKGTTLFLVDAGTPGFRRGRTLEKIGLHANDTAELFFDDVRLGDADILGAVDRGFAVLMAELPRERLMLANVAIAAVEGMLDQTIAYAHGRTLFGRPLSAFQVPRHRFADLLTQARAVRALVDQCVDRVVGGTLDAATASMAKLAATELQWTVADACLQLHGGYGYMSEYPIARAFVDARVQRIYGGTSEVMREIIAKAYLGAAAS